MSTPDERIAELEAEVERLKAGQRLSDTEWAMRCQTIGREGDKYRAIVTKLGRRLGRLRKRRKGELAVKTKRSEQLIAAAYNNGVLDSRHAHAAIAAHATRKGVSNDKPNSP